MQMTILDKIRLMKASVSSDIVEEITTPVVVTDPETPKNLNKKEKNVKANASAGDLTINLPTEGMVIYDTISITKTDDTANTVNIQPVDITLEYQYQSAIFTYDGSNWVLFNQEGSSFTPIIVGDTEPVDKNALWLDTSEGG